MSPRAILTLLAFAGALAGSVRAHADTRITVHDFHGQNANRMRSDVVGLLERETAVTLISLGQVESSAKKLGVDAFTPEGRIALARELQLSAWMTGVVKRQSGTLTLTVEVYDGAQHALVGRTSLHGRNANKLSDEIRKHLWRRSQGAILQASAPKRGGEGAWSAYAAKSAPEPKISEESEEDTEYVPSELPAPTRRAATDDELPPRFAASSVDSDEAAEDADAPSERKDQLLRMSLGLGSPYRALSYNDPFTPSLGNYRLSGTPMAEINAAFHPARLFTDDWMSWIGLDVRARLAASSSTTDRAGNKFNSAYNAYHVGLRGRIPIGEHHVSAFWGYAMSHFAIAPEVSGLVSPTPSVDYQMIRPGVGAEFAIDDDLRVGIDGAWLLIVKAGEIARWFPRSTAGGLEFAAFATYHLTSNLYMRADATYQRAYFDFHSKPEDARVAGGATDQYIAMSVGAGVSL